MYEVFRKNPQKYIKGVNILSYKVRSNAVPDFFLDVNGVFSVAEFKIDTFRKRHLFQLCEYMDIYSAEHGYAVAPKLNCVLPEKVTYVKMSNF